MYDLNDDGQICSLDLLGWTKAVPKNSSLGLELISIKNQVINE